MRVLLVGVGGVGEAIAVIAKSQPWVECILFSDYNHGGAKEVQEQLSDNARFPVERVDATYQDQIEALAKKYQVDLIMNACDPSFNIPIFEAAYHFLRISVYASIKSFGVGWVVVGSFSDVKLGDYQ